MSLGGKNTMFLPGVVRAFADPHLAANVGHFLLEPVGSPFKAIRLANSLGVLSPGDR